MFFDLNRFVGGKSVISGMPYSMLVNQRDKDKVFKALPMEYTLSGNPF